MVILNLCLTMRLQLVVVLLLCQMLNVYHAEFTHDRKRLGPMDLVRAEHGCLEKFEVSESTIIRTHDSREMGANFLNESDVGNREDCLTLCCSTHLCNVAVFEEKGAGSCYMFDCGQPDDFKCKFTSHTYYTSSVLRLNRHQLELGLWSEQRQHEAELANLRSPLDLEASLPVSTIPSTSAPKTTTTTTTTTSAPVSTTTTARSTLPPRKCRRYEFECHSGECIAIYNACDGIPQCQDKSDEDSALGCPAASTEGTPPVRGVGSASGPGTTWDNQAPPRDNGYGPGYDRGIFNHRSNILENYSHYPPSTGGATEEGYGYGGHGRGPAFYDYNQRPAWPGPRYNVGEGGGGGGGRGVNNEYQGPDNRHSFHYPDYGQPQQMPQSLQQQQQQQQAPPMNNPVWMDKPNYNSQQQQPMQDMQRLNMPGMPRQQQQTTLQQQRGAFQPSTNIKQQHLPGYQENLQNTELGMMNGENMQNSANQMTEMKTSQTTKGPPTTSPSGKSSVGGKSNNSQINSSVSNSKGGNGSTENGSNSRHSAVESAHEPHHSVAHSSLARLEVNLEELQIEAREQDAQASGAVLALAMGVCITALLVVLVGCRLRGVRRRLRKHRGARSPYAHDADYLVNGMYL